MAKITEDFPCGALLIGAGFTTTHKVEKATDEELLAIDGIGPAGVEKIRAVAVEPEPDGKSELVTEGAVVEARKCSNPNCGYEVTVSPCPYCGVA